MSFDLLQDKIRAMKNPTVAGLDARIEYVPEHIRQSAYAEYGVGLRGACEAIYQFNVGLIDALCDVVPAVKPQAAYYENLGWQGLEMLERTIRYAKSKGLFVIADIKRGDIGSTAAAYAEGWLSGAKIEGESFKSFDADCVTLNGYMGSDSIKPFLEAAKGEDKCVFVLVKTSNPGSGAVSYTHLDVYKRQVYIMTPYLVVSDSVNTALRNAAKSGVDVRIITPHIPDKKLVFELTRAH